MAKGGVKLKLNMGAPFRGETGAVELKFQTQSIGEIAKDIEGVIHEPDADKTGCWAGTTTT